MTILTQRLYFKSPRRWGAGHGLLGDSWRYKMTVSVDTPEGIKTGYAVREVTMHNSLAITPQMTGNIDVKGEAVVVDLGARGMVFALLSGYGLGADYGADISRYAFKMAGGQNYGGAVGTPAADGQAGKLDLPPTWYPLLVRFRDAADPKTVENLLEVKSCEPPHGNLCIDKNHFETAFGAGVKLRSVTIEMTKEKVTGGVEKYMPSFDDEAGFMQWFRSLPYGDVRRIGPYDFKQGAK